jgi:hypothetical protein
MRMTFPKHAKKIKDKILLADLKWPDTRIVSGCLHFRCQLSSFSVPRGHYDFCDAKLPFRIPKFYSHLEGMIGEIQTISFGDRMKFTSLTPHWKVKLCTDSHSIS